MISLQGLLKKFQPRNNFECQDAYHMTHIPWRGPHGYLNTIFKPTNVEVQRDIIDPVGKPLVGGFKTLESTKGCFF